MPELRAAFAVGEKVLVAGKHVAIEVSREAPSSSATRSCAHSRSSGNRVHDVDRLFRAYNEMLVRYLTRRLGDRDWAEEVAQETFVRALRQETMTNERAWLFTVANNLVRDEARKDSRRRRHLTMLYEEEKERVVEPEETTMERAQDAAMARAAVDGARRA